MSLRVVLALLCLAIALIQSRATWSRQGKEWKLERDMRLALASSTLPVATRLNSHGDLWFVFVIAALWFVYVLSRRDYVEESLLVIRGLGIQTSTSSPLYLTAPTTRFIPTSQLQDIFIHEAFIGFEVKYYLAVIVEGEKEAVVVFPKLLPRRGVLEDVWRGARDVLGWIQA